jgi:excinuclease ABC subunit C
MRKLEELLYKAQSLPQEAGCYLMRDQNGLVIYVGKAKKLKSRVQSYFNQSTKSLKTEFMVSHVVDFDFILTRSEAESLVLENNLIKEHSPKYNIRLRDDKSYPYLQINKLEPYPRLEYVRRPKKLKGIDLFGPFPTGSNISIIIRILTKSFELRDCSLTEFRNRKTPCLYHQMKQCSAPCVGLIDEKSYDSDLNQALDFFRGPTKAQRTIQLLRERMIQFAEDEEFERASILRDNLSLLEQFLKSSFDQKVEFLDSESHVDLWAYYDGGEEVDLSVYLIRSGLLIGQKNFHFMKGELIESIEDEFQQKILQYYADSVDVVPNIVVIDLDEELLGPLGLALSTFGHIKLKGSSKKYLPLLEMARKHAEESQRVRIQNADSVYLGLNKLKDLLGMKERPKILECYDVAIWQGSSPTASQIVFEEGKPLKNRYRYYHLETRPEGNNDFAMMKEVISRRVDNGDLPDIFVIDGGIAQVNIVCEVLKEMKIQIPVVGIAKSRDLTQGDLKSEEVSRTEERLIIPGRSNPYILKKCPSLFKIIVSMRDEAHRFSRKLHHKAETKRVLATWLDEVKGLNSESKKLILLRLKMKPEELKELNISDLVNYFGLKNAQARVLWEFLNKGEKN